MTQAFRDRLMWTALDLEIQVNDLAAVMGWETNRTFSASVKNMAGSGATGLLQFMPKTAISMGTTVEALAAMTDEDQLLYVHRYLKPYKGRMKTLADLYMAVLWPAAIGGDDYRVLWAKGTMPTTYLQNRGLDIDGDQIITKYEAATKVRDTLLAGLKEGEVWEGLVYPYKG